MLRDVYGKGCFTHTGTPRHYYQIGLLESGCNFVNFLKSRGNTGDEGLLFIKFFYVFESILYYLLYGRKGGPYLVFRYLEHRVFRFVKNRVYIGTRIITFIQYIGRGAYQSPQYGFFLNYFRIVGYVRRGGHTIDKRCQIYLSPHTFKMSPATQYITQGNKIAWFISLVQFKDRRKYLSMGLTVEITHTQYFQNIVQGIIVQQDTAKD